MSVMVRTRCLSRTLDRVIGRALKREHVDHATDEVHEQPEEVTVDDVVPDVEDFSGGSHDTLVLIYYVHHLAMTLVQMKKELRQYNVKGYMFDYRGCETFIVANVMSCSGL
ncbi:hypothetical protein HKD37_07G020256 [Glycine soja]